jgi:hypothetical protein
MGRHALANEGWVRPDSAHAVTRRIASHYGATAHPQRRRLTKRLRSQATALSLTLPNHQPQEHFRSFRVRELFQLL